MYPMKATDKNLKNMNTEDWAKESNVIASTFVYKGITEDEELPDDYKAKGKVIAEKQLVIAGYRLYNMLKGLDLSVHADVYHPHMESMLNLMSTQPPEAPVVSINDSA